MTFILRMGSPKMVTVHEEYLIYDLVSMIGAVGGTMGLCIGFSFDDFCSLILRYLELGYSKLRAGSREKPKPIFVQETLRQIKSREEAEHSKDGHFVSQNLFDTTIFELQNRIDELEVKILESAKA